MDKRLCRIDELTLHAGLEGRSEKQPSRGRRLFEKESSIRYSGDLVNERILAERRLDTKFLLSHPTIAYRSVAVCVQATGSADNHSKLVTLTVSLACREFHRSGCGKRRTVRAYLLKAYT